MSRVLVAALLLALTGCSGDASMTQSEVEAYVENAFEENGLVGTVTQVSCPRGLAAKEDASVTCRVTGSDDRTNVEVMVTAVDGDDLELELGGVILFPKRDGY